ncbi:hypothetical protein Tcan_03954 [Toxocara canis]|uniref:Uncharacterized protein n=2 Tax=Toxocara canis TaxID=6265 RepID=A0A0B2UMH7_TOXCA|nr:hypothetical protein Tcan_03954 [Toxocara canis]VDM43507.1 unnamed protein product [Toxocara canis]
MFMLQLHYTNGIAQEPDELDKRGGGRPFTLADKRAGGRFFKIQDLDALEKRGGGRPFYNIAAEKRGGGRAFRMENLGEKRAGARKIGLPELDLYESALTELGNWPLAEKRGGGRTFPVVDDSMEKRRIFDVYSRLP